MTIDKLEAKTRITCPACGVLCNVLFICNYTQKQISGTCEKCGKTVTIENPLYTWDIINENETLEQGLNNILMEVLFNTWRYKHESETCLKCLVHEKLDVLNNEYPDSFYKQFLMLKRRLEVLTRILKKYPMSFKRELFTKEYTNKVVTIFKYADIALGEVGPMEEDCSGWYYYCYCDCARKEHIKTYEEAHELLMSELTKNKKG